MQTYRINAFVKLNSGGFVWLKINIARFTSKSQTGRPVPCISTQGEDVKVGLLKSQTSHHPSKWFLTAHYCTKSQTARMLLEAFHVTDEIVIGLPEPLWIQQTARVQECLLWQQGSNIIVYYEPVWLQGRPSWNVSIKSPLLNCPLAGIHWIWMRWKTRGDSLVKSIDATDTFVFEVTKRDLIPNFSMKLKSKDTESKETVKIVWH